MGLVVIFIPGNTHSRLSLGTHLTCGYLQLLVGGVDEVVPIPGLQVYP